MVDGMSTRLARADIRFGSVNALIIDRFELGEYSILSSIISFCCGEASLIFLLTPNCRAMSDNLRFLDICFDKLLRRLASFFIADLTAFIDSGVASGFRMQFSGVLTTALSGEFDPDSGGVIFSLTAGSFNNFSPLLLTLFGVLLLLAVKTFIGVFFPDALFFGESFILIFGENFTFVWALSVTVLLNSREIESFISDFLFFGVFAGFPGVAMSFPGLLCIFPELFTVFNGDFVALGVASLVRVFFGETDFLGLVIDFPGVFVAFLGLVTVFPGVLVSFPGVFTNFPGDFSIFFADSDFLGLVTGFPGVHVAFVGLVTVFPGVLMSFPGVFLGDIFLAGVFTIFPGDFSIFFADSVFLGVDIFLAGVFVIFPGVFPVFFGDIDIFVGDIDFPGDVWLCLGVFGFKGVSFCCFGVFSIFPGTFGESLDFPGVFGDFLGVFPGVFSDLRGVRPGVFTIFPRVFTTFPGVFTTFPGVFAAFPGDFPGVFLGVFSRDSVTFPGVFLGVFPAPLGVFSLFTIGEAFLGVLQGVRPRFFVDFKGETIL